MNLSALRAARNEDNFKYFNRWVLTFFRREALRDSGRISEYEYLDEHGPAMRQEVSYWNPNRSKHAEVFWLENFVFLPGVSPRNRVCNAMAVKFVGMPTLTLVATDSCDYGQIIDFDRYKEDRDYYSWINRNLDENHRKIAVWGRTQLQTSLQTAARNYCREVDGNPDQKFSLSQMIRWISHLDDLGMTSMVLDKKNRLRDVCEWLRQFKGIGNYFAYHPPCNFSRDKTTPHIDEDDDYCLPGPGSMNGLRYVFPDVKMTPAMAEELIVSVKHNQHEFFEFSSEEEHEWYRKNLERGGNLTTFGTEITFCQFSVFMSIKDDPASQEKRILPLTFESFQKIADGLKVNRLF